MYFSRDYRKVARFAELEIRIVQFLVGGAAELVAEVIDGCSDSSYAGVVCATGLDWAELVGCHGS
jgi:hypothetical protein